MRYFERIVRHGNNSWLGPRTPIVGGSTEDSFSRPLSKIIVEWSQKPAAIGIDAFPVSRATQLQKIGRCRIRSRGHQLPFDSPGITAVLRTSPISSSMHKLSSPYAEG